MHFPKLLLTMMRMSKIGFVVLMTVLSMNSCTKDDQNDPRALELDIYSLPTVTTKSVTEISQVSAVSGGRVLTDGGTPVTSYGVCWSTLQYPTIEDSKTNDGSGVFNFTSKLTNLSVSTTYYLRAFAKNKNGVAYGGQQKFTTESALAIGVEYAGGIIFYLDASGTHGLVCATSDQSLAAVWGCTNYQVPGAEGSVLGTGNENTNEIINNCLFTGIAAGICSQLVHNGYDDWFLPSKDELKLMYTNLKLTGLANFSNTAYWSSTQMTDVFAWQIAFNSGIVQGASKSTPSAVRAIRAF